MWWAVLEGMVVKCYGVGGYQYQNEQRLPPGRAHLQHTHAKRVPQDLVRI